VAIDARGRSGSLEADTIVSSTDPAGGPAAWRETSFAGRSDIAGGLGSVSCPSAHFCAISTNGGDAILTSTDPMGGPSAWKLSSVPFYIDDLICASARMCVGINNRALLATSNPTGGARAWHLSFTRSTLTPEHLGCASPHLCVVTA